MTDMEKKHIRLYAWIMLGLYTAGMAVLAVLAPGWQGFLEPMDMVIFGGVLMGMAIPCHILAGKSAKKWAWHKVFYIVSLILNLMGTALCQSAYLTHMQARPSAGALLVGCLIIAGICLLFAVLVSLLPALFRVFTVIFGISAAILAYICIISWVDGGVKQSSAPWSMGFFMFLGLIITMVAFFYACEDVDMQESPMGWMRYLSFASFGLFLLVAVIVLLILACIGGDGCDCDCDCCSGAECCDCGSGGSTDANIKKKKKKL